MYSSNNKQQSNLNGGVFLTKPAPIEQWENYVDDVKMGHIPIVFQQSISVAKPLFHGMQFQVPSKEFIETYFDDIGIYVQVAKDHPSRIWWIGFTFFENKCFDELLEDYPYARAIYFDEKWKFIANAKEDNNYIRITHNDGSEFRIDPSNKMVSILNQESESSVIISDKKYEVIDGSGNYSVSTKNTIINTDDTYLLNTKDTTINSTDSYALNTIDSIIKATNKSTVEAGEVSISADTIAEIKAEILNIEAETNIVGNVTMSASLSVIGPIELGRTHDFSATKAEEVIDKLELLIDGLSSLVSFLQQFSTAQATVSIAPPLSPLNAGYTTLGASISTLPNRLSILKDGLDTIKSSIVTLE